MTGSAQYGATFEFSSRGWTHENNQYFFCIDYFASNKVFIADNLSPIKHYLKENADTIWKGFKN